MAFALGLFGAGLLITMISHFSCDATFVTQDQSIPAIRRITSAKGSNVNLEWKYQIAWNAKKVNQVCSYENGTVTVPLAEGKDLRVLTRLPTYFAGRLQASKSTLVLQNIQFTDTSYTFSSYLLVKGLFNKENTKTNLRPVYYITVTGPPEFSQLPESEIHASEGSSVNIWALVASNPKPIAEFTMPQLSAKRNVTTSQEYQFTYKASCTLHRVTSEFCGRTIRTRFSNSIGSSRTAETLIKMKFDPSIGLAVSRPNASCFEVRWYKRDAGKCIINYRIDFMNSSGSILNTEAHDDIGSVIRCDLPDADKITQVALIMSSNSSGQTRAVVVTPTSAPGTKATGQNYMKVVASDSHNTSAIHYGYGAVAVVLFVSVVIIFIRNFILRKRKNRGKQNLVGNNRGLNGFDASAVKHYMDIQVQYADDATGNGAQTSYAALENAGYEVTKTEEYDKFSQGYVNFSRDYVNFSK